MFAQHTKIKLFNSVNLGAHSSYQVPNRYPIWFSVSNMFFKVMNTIQLHNFNRRGDKDEYDD